MGAAAYNRGSKIIRLQIDRELEEKYRRPVSRLTLDSYADRYSCALGETVYTVCDEIGLVFSSIFEHKAIAYMAKHA